LIVVITESLLLKNGTHSSPYTNNLTPSDPKLTIPYPDPTDTKRYGRIHSLTSIPELADEPLYKVAVTTPGEALAVLSALC